MKLINEKTISNFLKDGYKITLSSSEFEKSTYYIESGKVWIWVPELLKDPFIHTAFKTEKELSKFVCKMYEKGSDLEISA